MANIENISCKYSSMEKINHTGFGIRHLQALLLFLLLVVAYAMRSAMGVAILAMTDNKANQTQIDTYQWDKKTQDTILSSFYWGYMLMQIPSGILSHYFGGWVLLITALAVNSVASVSTPIIAHYGGWKAVCAVRMIQGLTQSSIFPSMHALLSKWIPVSERGRIATFVYSATSIGTIISMPLAGLLTTTSLGWPTIFYTCGISAIIMAVLYYFLGSNDPAKHKRISTRERQFIEASTGAQSSQGKVLPTPWKSIMMSRPVMALCLTHVGSNWATLTMLLETPSYMKNILNINVEQSGLLAGLPYLAAWLVGTIASFFSDYIINKKICSIATTRKIMNSIGCWIPSAFLIFITFLPEGNSVLAIVFFTIITGASGSNHVGFMVNHMDLSPNFAGILMGITNTFANLIAIGAPIIAGFILNDHEESILRWRIVFCISAGLNSITNLLFVVFGRGDIQHWNTTKSRDKCSNDDVNIPLKS